MPRIALTDIALKALKPRAKQTQYWDASLPAFGCRINPKGTKTFNVMIGKERRLIKIGNYPAMALSEARQAAHTLLNGDPRPRRTFEAARTLFINEHLSRLKQTTCHEQTNLLNRLPFTGQAEDLDLTTITAFLDKLPPGSARTSFNILRTFFNWCVENNHLAATPLKKSPYKPRFRERLLTDGEMREIWKHSYQHGQWGNIIRSLIISGQRLNQLCSFDHAWIKGDIIAFPPSVMKHNQYHSLPLTPLLKQHLPTLTKPFTSVSTAMAKFRASLPVEHHTAHDYRRYHSSTAAMLRTPIDVEESILAHTAGSRSQIQRIYDRFDRVGPMRIALETFEHHLHANVIDVTNGN